MGLMLFVSRCIRVHEGIVPVSFLFVLCTLDPMGCTRNIARVSGEPYLPTPTYLAIDLQISRHAMIWKLDMTNNYDQVPPTRVH